MLAFGSYGRGFLSYLCHFFFQVDKVVTLALNLGILICRMGNVDVPYQLVARFKVRTLQTPVSA